jgi:HPr kinase/phosphorylase
MSTLLHATCVALDGRGILLTGGSGVGKSDLALRLIDRGATLVADDGVMIETNGDQLLARPGPNIAGQIEVRGIGILTLPFADRVPLALCVALDLAVPRLPDEQPPTRMIEEVSLPLIALAPFEASAPVKVEKALIVYGLPI